MNQYIRLYLENRKIPSAIAAQAAAMITPTQVGVTADTGDLSLKALLDVFIDLYALEGEKALETIEGNLFP